MVNYFEVLSIDTKYDISLKELDEAYFQMQLKYHPDRFATKPEAERLEAQAKSELANTAYTVLKNPFSRAEHMVNLNGFSINEEFRDMELMEKIFEWHDAFADNPEKTMQEISELKSHLENDLSTQLKSMQFKEAATTLQKLKFVDTALKNK